MRRHERRTRDAIMAGEGLLFPALLVMIMGGCSLRDARAAQERVARARSASG
jgi:hypothetical protein